ncbi:S41 family peptidase [Mesorhizobium sp. LHD-90]|nr:S41 family peptidase [Mesorhizobium sp. LHD-90]MDQ6435994.1 S41 family peptidase [Mesorhizobium sp. LHD-90]
MLSALIILVLTAGPAPAAEPPRSGHAVFDRAVQLVVREFYDVSALDRFSDAVRREVEDPQSPVNAKSSEARVDAAIETILASLQASHVGHFRPDTIDYFELADIFRFAIRDDRRRLFPPQGEVTYPGIGMVARQRDGAWFASDVYDGSPAARAGILAGDEIMTIDGMPYREIASFEDKVGKAVEVKLRRSDGAEPISVKVQVERLRPLPMFERAIRDSARLIQHDGQKIGYVRLWTLAAPRSMEIVAEALAKGPLKDANGLVLDLRGRWGGGSSDAAELFLGDTPPFRLIQRDGEDILANVRWNRPVIAIIDEGTRSGLEVFAYALKANGIPLVGARSAGALLAGRAYLLPDDSLLEIAVSDAVIGDDVRLEGIGVQPDVSVPFSLPYAAGRDGQLDAAVEEMRRILARG